MRGGMLSGWFSYGGLFLGLEISLATFVWIKLGARTKGSGRKSSASPKGTPAKPRRLRRRLSVFDQVQVPKENPFDYDNTEVTELERVILSVGAVTLLPLRAVVLVGSLLVCSVFAKLSILGLSTEELRTKPLPRWRRCFQWYTMRPCFRTVLFSLGFFWFEEEGLENIGSSKDAPIVVPSHRSFVEPAYYLYKFMATPIAAIENISMPIVSTITTALQTVTVSRKDKNSKKNVIEQMKARAHAGWPHILIFPEGTTTNGKTLITFKSGAFIPGVPVQPCAMTYPCGRTPFGFKTTDPTWVYAGISQGEIFFRMLASPFTRMRITFLPVYSPKSPQERPDLQPTLKQAALAARKYGSSVRKIMCESLGVKSTEHSVEDVFLQKEAMKNRLPAHAGVVEYTKLHRMFNLDLPTLKRYQKTFSEMDVDKSGNVTLEEFLGVYNAPEDQVPELVSLFHMLDDDENGVINFQEYLLGLALLAEGNDGSSVKDGIIHDNPEHHRKVLRLAFRILDTNGNDRVGKKDVERVMSRSFQNIDNERFSALFKAAGGTEDGHMDFESFKKLASLKLEYRDALEHVVPTINNPTGQLQFRRVVMSDAKKLASIVERAYRDGDTYFIDYERVVPHNKGPSQYTRTSLSEIEVMVRDTAGIFYCAEIGPSNDNPCKIVGCGFVKALNGQGRASGSRLKGDQGDNNSDACELGFLCTNLEFSKLGFGQQLARHGIQLAKEAGYKTIAIGVISHKPWLQEWYRKRMGFKYMHNEKSEKIVEEWPAPVKAFLKDGYLETHFVKMRLRV